MENRVSWHHIFHGVILLVGLFALQALAAVPAYDYGDALDKTLMFFEAQRSGKLPFSNNVKWRADSAMRDGFSQGVSN